MKTSLKGASIAYHVLGEDKQPGFNYQEFWANADFLETKKYKCRNWLVLGRNLLLPWLD